MSESLRVYLTFPSGTYRRISGRFINLHYDHLVYLNGRQCKAFINMNLHGFQRDNGKVYILTSSKRGEDAREAHDAPGGYRIVDVDVNYCANNKICFLTKTSSQEIKDSASFKVFRKKPNSPGAFLVFDKGEDLKQWIIDNTFGSETCGRNDFL